MAIESILFLIFWRIKLTSSTRKWRNVELWKKRPTPILMMTTTLAKTAKTTICNNFKETLLSKIRNHTKSLSWKSSGKMSRIAREPKLTKNNLIIALRSSVWRTKMSFLCVKTERKLIQSTVNWITAWPSSRRNSLLFRTLNALFVKRPMSRA